jgi:hypothetical protein
MTLGSTKPLTEMSTRNLPGGKRRPVSKADNLTAICELIVYKIWDPRRLTTLWASTTCYRHSFRRFSVSNNKKITKQAESDLTGCENVTSNKNIPSLLNHYKKQTDNESVR